MSEGVNREAPSQTNEATRTPFLIPSVLYRIKDASLVIRPALLNREGPVELLEQQQAGEIVGKGHR